jgi:hypothetical protein
MYIFGIREQFATRKSTILMYRACSKSHSTVINHTRACWNHTLRSEITLVRMFITLMLVNITLFLWTSHYAWCDHHTMHVTITLCMWPSHYACEHHTIRVNIALCVWTSHYACEHHTIAAFFSLSWGGGWTVITPITTPWIHVCINCMNSMSLYTNYGCPIKKYLSLEFPHFLGLSSIFLRTSAQRNN